MEMFVATSYTRSRVSLSEASHENYNQGLLENYPIRGGPACALLLGSGDMGIAVLGVDELEYACMTRIKCCDY